MKYIKILSPEANALREKFQQNIVIPHIKEKGDLRGYKGQIYLLMPKYDRKLSLYKNISKETYNELHKYLMYTQSQLRFSQLSFNNGMAEVKCFDESDLSICYRRVWHNGATCYTDKRHRASQLKALHDNIGRYKFTFYMRDYNFPDYCYIDMERNANPLLVAIYKKIIERKLGVPEIAEAV